MPRVYTSFKAKVGQMVEALSEGLNLNYGYRRRHEVPKASLIIAKMLEFWGPTGARWCVGLGIGGVSKSMQQGFSASTRGCIWGAAGIVQNAHVIYADRSEDNEMHKALAAIEAQILKQYPNTGGDIVNFNDNSKSFARIKKVCCAALKDCLATEEQEDEKHGTRTS